MSKSKCRDLMKNIVVSTALAALTGGAMPAAASDGTMCAFFYPKNSPAEMQQLRPAGGIEVWSNKETSWVRSDQAIECHARTLAGSRPYPLTREGQDRLTLLGLGGGVSLHFVAVDLRDGAR